MTTDIQDCHDDVGRVYGAMTWLLWVLTMPIELWLRLQALFGQGR